MYKNFFKRMIDLIIALIALPFWIVILIVIGPFIYFSDNGPIFYNAPRLGKDGKVFMMYKFRSMKINAPDLRNEDGSTFNAENDPRLTKIGKLIRKTSLDETPQLLNIIKGDMSIIGPRPSIPNKKVGNISFLRLERRRVRPGITGFTQAYFRNSITQDEKLKYDAHYVNNISFKLDLEILIQTIKTVINKDGIFVKDVTKQGSKKNG